MAKEYSNFEIGSLAEAFCVHIDTIRRWIKDNDDRLTSDKAKGTIEWCHQYCITAPFKVKFKK